MMNAQGKSRFGFLCERTVLILKTNSWVAYELKSILFLNSKCMPTSILYLAQVVKPQYSNNTPQLLLQA